MIVKYSFSSAPFGAHRDRPRSGPPLSSFFIAIFVPHRICPAHSPSEGDAAGEDVKAIKVIELTGTSEKSWEDAADNAVKEAQEAVSGITGVELVGQTANGLARGLHRS